MSHLLSISRFFDNGEPKSFCHFPEMFPELRMLIVDKMESDDRCRFSRSSKLANKEAKASKNYIYELAINICNSEIIVRHGTPNQSYRGYYLKIVEEQEKMYLKCLTLRNRELWTTMLDSSTNWQRFLFEQFKTLLLSYHKVVKKLWLDIFRYGLDDIDSGVNSFNNLEVLHVLRPFVLQRILSKTRKPLKSLNVPDKIDDEILEDCCEQIFQVQNTLELIKTPLNNQQFLRLSASEIKLPIGNLTEHDIFNFVRSWQNGTIGRKIKKYEWNLENSKFDLVKFFGLFGEHYVGRGMKQLDIKHQKEVGKVARLEFVWILLIFEMV